MPIKNKKNDNLVSIITITQLCRFNCLKILYQMIQNQTYKNILEWVIVEGSQNIEAANQNKINILELKKICHLNINYIEYTSKKALGALRNSGNNACKGNIIVCFDDDDFYFNERIEEAVNKLSNSPCLIGGVSDVLLYDFFLDKLYKFKGFMEFHSTNNCMAYKKDFLIENKHDPEIMVGEERSFTSEFTKPLVKFDSWKTIIAISHSFNTFNKRELCVTGSLGLLHTLVEIEQPITNFIQVDIFNQMKAIYFPKDLNSPYDIVYLLGCYSQNFDPKSKLLNASETSIVSFSEYCSKEKNKKVAVYGDFDLDNDKKINNVDYIHWKKFPYHLNFQTVILWKSCGILNGFPFDLKAKNIIWESHENSVGNDKFIEIWSKYNHLYKIKKTIFKSNFHLTEISKQLSNITNAIVIPSGIRINEYKNNWDKVTRNPYRFCYTASYDRGIEFIVKGIFSVIKKIEPRAELHIYSGMELINDENFQKKMIKIFSENGVTDHGKQGYDIISREKHLSSFHIYISNIVNEIDPIDIKESIIAGCIPLTVNFGVFLETDGIRFHMNHEDSKGMQRIGLEILQLMKDQKKLDQIRNQFYNNIDQTQNWNQYCYKLYQNIYN